MKKAVKNVSQSVRNRLLNLAKQRREDFQLLLTRYTNERMLFRLAQSQHNSYFVLKGATLFMYWTGQPHRTTRDVDLLSFGHLSEQAIRKIFIEILEYNTEDDGVRFDIETLKVGPIREEQTYGGIRVEVNAYITTARVPVQIDIGFGDAITPKSELVHVPTLLDFPAPCLRAYPPETVVAEKIEAMVQLGMANSRMKDFYDLLVISKHFNFDGKILVQAIEATFSCRKTSLPEGLPIALTPTFSEDSIKKTQWSGFIRKSGVKDAGSLHDTIKIIGAFITRPLKAAHLGETFAAQWQKDSGIWK